MRGQAIPIAFPNKDGLRLFGILHRPEHPRHDAAILLLSPGVKMRVAPHRLYPKMVERFVALGYTVLRFDFHGLGDAEGEAPEQLLADLYGATQVGRYVADTIAAIDWMQQTHGISKFIAAGLCGGALTGMLAAADARITALLALSIPVIVDGSNIDASRYMTDAQLKGTRQRYFRKFRLRDARVWRSWMRFLTFQSHYSLIARSVVKPLTAQLRRKPAGEATAAPAVQDNTNPHFAPAFMRMVRTKRRVLFVFAGSDRLRWEFEGKFLQRHAEELERYAPWFEVHVTEQANHIFSALDWQRDMLDRSCEWLDSLTPRRTEPIRGAAAALTASAH